MPSQFLPWHRRLKARVGAGVIVLVALSMAAMLAATTRAVTSRSFERAGADLDRARSAFYELADDRAAFASAQAALVTALPIFRAHVTDHRLVADGATLHAMAEQYREQLKASFVVVADRSARWTAASGWSAEPRADARIRAVIDAATAGRTARDIVSANAGLFLVVTEPARFGDELLATLTVGYALDDGVAERLARVTHCDINIVSGGRLYASSLRPADRAALADLAASDVHAEMGVSDAIQRVGDGRYVVGNFPLTSTTTELAGRLVLLKDWEASQRFVDEVQRGVLAAGAISFCIAFGAALAFSHRMARPLQDLASAAEDIAAGNWARRVTARGSAEETLVADAFNQMTTSLRHWYEQAKRRDDELRQAQKLEALGRLAGGIAHDFNNLLTAIKGYAELITGGLSASDQRRGDADEIIKAADRAASLTQQLLAFSRRQAATPRALALNRLLSGTGKMLRRLIGEDISLTTVIPQDLRLVCADPTQMEQVIINLAVNARDAVAGGGSLRIELANFTCDGALRSGHPLPPGNYVRLSVTDTGCGMSEETRSHIFEPFFTTKEEGRGTGLGLAMVYGIVDQAGGSIEVQSEVGRGTTFHVYLPETTEPEAAPPDLSTAVSPSAPAVETVLLVEDDTAVRTLIATGLTKSGYTVLEADRAERALQIVRDHAERIDLLLTDVVMPGMNGRELANRFRAMRVESRVLFMSGYSDDAILRHGVQTATADFIHKPFSIETLRTRIRETLGA